MNTVIAYYLLNGAFKNEKRITDIFILKVLFSKIIISYRGLKSYLIMSAKNVVLVMFHT
jgi:hypothetical protein